jgi:hypothetical protein
MKGRRADRYKNLEGAGSAVKTSKDLVSAIGTAL